MTDVNEAVAELYRLEDEVTTTRIMEFLLGIDTEWLQHQYDLMQVQRAIIKGQ